MRTQMEDVKYMVNALLYASYCVIASCLVCERRIY